jgi:hypothetical protein
VQHQERQAEHPERVLGPQLCSTMDALLKLRTEEQVRKLRAVEPAAV